MALRIGLPSQIEAASEPTVMTEEEAPMMDQMAAPEAMPMDEPQSAGFVAPEAAKYMTSDMRCQSCTYFIEPGSCDVVAGPIDPQGVCMIWTPMEQGMPMETETPMEEPVEEAPIEEAESEVV